MPFFSVITTLSHVSAGNLKETIKSVQSQTVRDWQWIIVDDASSGATVSSVVRSVAEKDSRVTLIECNDSGRIVEALNDGIDAAVGQWIALLDAGDLLTPDALAQVHSAIKDNPTSGYIYSDEDTIHGKGNYVDRYVKPDWAPEKFRHHMYTGHLSVLRADIVRSVGKYRAGFDGARDYDLILRVSEQCENIVHIRKVLYHCHTPNPLSSAGTTKVSHDETYGAIKAIQEHLDRCSITGTVTQASVLDDKGARRAVAGLYSIERTISPEKKISVIVPTCGSTALVREQERCMVVDMARSLYEKRGTDNVEFIAVYDSHTPTDVVDELQKIWGERYVGVEYTKPFNFSDKCNEGFARATGDYVVFMNDDMEVISDNFLPTLCAPLAEEDCGMTGARLIHEDETIQHAGLVSREREVWHAYLNESNHATGYFYELCMNHETTGLTGACIALRREVFEEVERFSKIFPNNFNDVDLSHKVCHAGYRLVWLWDCRCYHYESKTREAIVTMEELELLIKRWGEPLYDPYMPWAADKPRQSVFRKKSFVTLVKKIRNEGVITTARYTLWRLKLEVRRARNKQ